MRCWGCQVHFRPCGGGQTGPLLQCHDCLVLPAVLAATEAIYEPTCGVGKHIQGLGNVTLLSACHECHTRPQSTYCAQCSDPVGPFRACGLRFRA